MNKFNKTNDLKKSLDIGALSSSILAKTQQTIFSIISKYQYHHNLPSTRTTMIAELNNVLIINHPSFPGYFVDRTDINEEIQGNIVLKIKLRDMEFDAKQFKELLQDKRYHK